MINRILIRIKVVQILYSYLLSRSEFKIDAAPQGASRDRRFAYAVYLDMLCLIQELSGVRTNNPERRLPAIPYSNRLHSRIRPTSTHLARNCSARPIKSPLQMCSRNMHASAPTASTRM